jgi:uncharacterized membrane protein YkvA (DUF1232 family)
LKHWIIYALCIAYIASPIDLIPDFIPVFGWLDDIGVLGFMVHTYLQYRNEIEALARRADAVEPLVLESPPRNVRVS